MVDASNRYLRRSFIFSIWMQAGSASARSSVVVGDANGGGSVVVDSAAGEPAGGVTPVLRLGSCVVSVMIPHPTRAPRANEAAIDRAAGHRSVRGATSATRARSRCSRRSRGPIGR